MAERSKPTSTSARTSDSTCVIGNGVVTYALTNAPDAGWHASDAWRAGRTRACGRSRPPLRDRRAGLRLRADTRRPRSRQRRCSSCRRGPSRWSIAVPSCLLLRVEDEVGFESFGVRAHRLELLPCVDSEQSLLAVAHEPPGGGETFHRKGRAARRGCGEQVLRRAERHAGGRWRRFVERRELLLKVLDRRLEPLDSILQLRSLLAQRLAHALGLSGGLVELAHQFVEALPALLEIVPAQREVGLCRPARRLVRDATLLVSLARGERELDGIDHGLGFLGSAFGGLRRLHGRRVERGRAGGRHAFDLATQVVERLHDAK